MCWKGYNTVRTFDMCLLVGNVLVAHVLVTCGMCLDIL